MGEEDTQTRGAVDLGALLQVQRDAGEEVAHQPHHDGQVDGGVGGDQRNVGVQQADLLEHEIDRQDDHHRRQDAVGDDPEQDVVVAERAPEVAPHGGHEEDEEHDRDRGGGKPRGAEAGDREDGQAQENQKRKHIADLDPILDADQRVGRQGAHQHAGHRGAEGDDDRVDVGAQGVVAELEQDVVPGVGRGREVDEGNEVGPVVHLDRQLERGDEEPVEREQHHQQPEDEKRVDEHLGGRRHRGDLVRQEETPQQVALGNVHSSVLRVLRPAKLKNERQVTVATKSSM